jgi:hypothetical protein
LKDRLLLVLDAERTADLSVTGNSGAVASRSAGE